MTYKQATSLMHRLDYCERRADCTGCRYYDACSETNDIALRDSLMDAMRAMMGEIARLRFALEVQGGLPNEQADARAPR